MRTRRSIQRIIRYHKNSLVLSLLLLPFVLILWLVFIYLLSSFYK